jgi:hypothetical protein
VVVPATKRPITDLGISLNDVIVALRHSGNRFVRDDYPSGAFVDYIFIANGCLNTCDYTVWGTPDHITKISFFFQPVFIFNDIKRIVFDMKKVIDIIFTDWPNSDEWMLKTTMAIYNKLCKNCEIDHRLQRDGKIIYISVSRLGDGWFSSYMFDLDIYAPAPMAPGTPDEAAADQALRGQLVDADGQCNQAKLQALLADYCPAAAAIDAAEQESKHRFYRDDGDSPSHAFQPGDIIVPDSSIAWQDAPDQPNELHHNYHENHLPAGTRITITSRIAIPKMDAPVGFPFNYIYYGFTADGVPSGVIDASSLEYLDTIEGIHARFRQIETLIDGDLAPLRRAFWKKTGYPFWTVATPMVACGIDKACKP